MPKIKPLSSKQIKDENLKLFARQLDSRKVLNNMTDEDVCAKVHIGTSTMSRRRQNPAKFELGELIELANVLGVQITISKGGVSVHE